MPALQTQLQAPTRPPSEPRWTALTRLPTESGAIIIRNDDKEFVGWATGVRGDTVEAGQPDRRGVEEIRRNAVKIALAPRMLDVCRLLVHGSRHEVEATAEAADLAAEVLSEMERLS